MKITIVLYPRLAKWQSLISGNIYSSFDRIWVAGTRFMALLFWLGVTDFFYYFLVMITLFFLSVYFCTRTDRFNGSFGFNFLKQTMIFSFFSLKSFTLSRMFFKLFSVFVRNNTQKIDFLQIRHFCAYRARSFSSGFSTVTVALPSRKVINSFFANSKPRF